MKDDLREAVARAMAGEEVWTGNNSLYPAMRLNWLERADAAIAAARPVIEREATAAIVAWLRAGFDFYTCWNNGNFMQGMADAIERGEHLPAKPAG
jgi:hypothetical protein